MERLHAIVEGIVQGVSYRAYTVDAARLHGLSGWVKNLPDGRVEVVAEGDRSALQALEQFLHQGSPAAVVRNVQVQWKASTGEFSGFRVRYD